MENKALVLSFFLVLALLLVSCNDDEINPDDKKEKLQLAYVVTDVSEYGMSDGAINITVCGGKSPYNYHWSNQSDTEDLSNIPAGIYSVTVIDAVDSSIHEKITIDQPAPLQLYITESIIYPTTKYAKDGSIAVSVSGGVLPYKYEWNTLDTTATILNVGIGTYKITVTDSRNESADKIIAIQDAQSTELELNAEIIQPSDKFTQDGSISLSIFGGTPPYTFKWEDETATSSLTNVGNGSYYVTISDVHNQILTHSFTLKAAPIIDYDGNEYDLVKIGNQIWLSENLKVTHNPEGEEIDSYNYNDLASNADIYGKLYTWNVAMNGSTKQKAQGICPKGYHIPTDIEWQDLEIAIGMSLADATLANTWRGNGIGTAMKEGGTSGFDVKLSGRRNSSGTYSLIDEFAYIWSSTEQGSNYAWRRCLDINSSKVGRWNTFPKTYGFSVRCLKNE